MAINFSGVKAIKLKVKLPGGGTENKEVAKIQVKNGPVLWQATGITIDVKPNDDIPGDITFDPIEELLD